MSKFNQSHFIITNRLKNYSNKFEGTLIGKLVNYWKNILNDYKTVAIETKVDIIKHPLKTSIYTAGLLMIGTLIYNNPTEQDFYKQLVSNTNDLLLVGEAIRNPQTDRNMQYLTDRWNKRLLKRFNIGILSLMWVDDFDGDCDIYEAHCKYLKVSWKEWWDSRIVDVGVMGKWWRLKREMKEYDVNPEEWKKVDKEKDI